MPLASRHHKRGERSVTKQIYITTNDFSGETLTARDFDINVPTGESGGIDFERDNTAWHHLGLNSSNELELVEQGFSNVLLRCDTQQVFAKKLLTNTLWYDTNTGTTLTVNSGTHLTSSCINAGPVPSSGDSRWRAGSAVGGLGLINTDSTSGNGCIVEVRSHNNLGGILLEQNTTGGRFTLYHNKMSGTGAGDSELLRHERSAPSTLQILGNSITSGQFGYLGSLNQSLNTTASPAFANITASGNLNVNGNANVTGTLGVTGLATFANVTASGTLNVAGVTSLGDITEMTNHYSACISATVDQSITPLYTTVLFDTTVFDGTSGDTNEMADLTNNKITIRKTGTYLVSYKAITNGVTARCLCAVRLNSSREWWYITSPSGSSEFTPSIVFTESFTSGDVIDVQHYHGNTVSIQNANYPAQLSVIYIGS